MTTGIDNFHKIISDSLKHKRISLNVTKSRLSRVSKISRHTIDEIENCTRDCRIKSVLSYWLALKKIQVNESNKKFHCKNCGKKHYTIYKSVKCCN